MEMELTGIPRWLRPPNRKTNPVEFAFPLALLFAGSGCAALIYEIVWFQLLQLVIGSSAVSLAVLLGTFMGGLCLGSLALSRWISTNSHPLRVYACLELAIALFSVAILVFLPAVTHLYVSRAGQGVVSILIRGMVCALFLLPPTVCMGATLPAVARWVDASPRGASMLGLFYGSNTLGAVAGCLLAGFYLLRVYDLVTATVVGITINLLVVAASWLMANLSPESKGSPLAVEPNPGRESPGAILVFVAIGLSGFTALGAEVVWTRLLSLMMGPSVYAFSIILAVFLLGLGLGSGGGSWLASRTSQPRVALGTVQLLLTVAMAWAGYQMATSLPFWPINPALSSSPWFDFQLDILRCFWALMPATVLWGASFPLALSAATLSGQDPGKWAGRIYAANTLGAILGAVGSSLILISWLGTRNAQRVLMGLSALAGLALLLHSWLLGRSVGSTNPNPVSSPHPLQRAIATLVLFLVAGWLIWRIPEIPVGLITQGRYLPTKRNHDLTLYVGEGLNASVAVTQTSTGVRNFHVSGKVEASTEPQDMRMQRMLGHLPALIHPQPRSVLVVGCGAGVTAGSLVVHPEVNRLVICEIEPLIPQAVAPFFTRENHGVLADPRTEVVYDDARHFILTTPEKFDIITSDPIHPWVKGAATLYTREYFELLKRHLHPGGLVTQWVPLYESNLGVVKCEIATFFAAFPHGTIWSNDREGEGYDVVLLGQVEPGRINLDRLHDHWLREPKVAQSLQDIGFRSLIGLLATYAGQAPDLRTWLANAEINLDRNLRLQYMAGLVSNLDQGGYIYDDLAQYRRFPEELFEASDARLQMLRYAIEGQKAIGK